MPLNTTHIFVTITALISAAGTILMRFGGRDTDFTQGLKGILSSGHLWLLGMLVCWVAGLGLALLLTKNEITVAYSIFVPLTYLFTSFGAFLLLGEQISIFKLVGIGFILCGLVILLHN